MNARDVRTVLLVEDNPDDILLLERAWRKAQLPHTLQVVRDGEVAVAYLAGHGVYADRDQYPLPALILLDLKLPRMSGPEVLAWLRSQPLLRRLIVVALTTSRQVDDVQRMYDLGVNSYLAKPPAPGQLLALVQSLSAYWVGLNEPPNH
jgi:CheY-like chemotaxis protein